MILALFTLSVAGAQTAAFGDGKQKLTVKAVAKNAFRVQYTTTESASILDELPDWAYVKHDEIAHPDIKAEIDPAKQTLTIKDQQGRVVFTAMQHQLKATNVAGTPVMEATLAFASPKDESLFGLGQFQDGYSNIRGLSRRLTQVNTQISIPMLLSSKGYGILWNNYGLTEFNPCEQSVKLTKRHFLQDTMTGTLIQILSTLQKINLTRMLSGPGAVLTSALIKANSNITKKPSVPSWNRQIRTTSKAATKNV